MTRAEPKQRSSNLKPKPVADIQTKTSKTLTESIDETAESLSNMDSKGAVNSITKDINSQLSVLEKTNQDIGHLVNDVEDTISLLRTVVGGQGQKVNGDEAKRMLTDPAQCKSWQSYNGSHCICAESSDG